MAQAHLASLDMSSVDKEEPSSEEEEEERVESRQTESAMGRSDRSFRLCHFFHFILVFVSHID